MKPAPTTTLFLQALGLVVATLVAVIIATTLVLLNIPPPAPEVYTVPEVAQALRNGQAVQTVEGRSLDVRHPAHGPPNQAPGRRHANFRIGLAQVLKLPLENVVITQTQQRFVAFVGPQSQTVPRRPPLGAERPEQSLIFGSFQAWVRQPSGAWVMVEPRAALIAPWQLRVLLVLAAAALAVTPLAWWFARRLAAPLAAFAGAAERLGRDPDAPPLDIKGSREIRAAVSAFNEMQERLRRYVNYRTAMVGAIAHDLRTPLTRLRFRIESAPDELKSKLAMDIDEMEAMVAATMAFVKDAMRPGERSKLELSSLVETVMDDA